MLRKLVAVYSGISSMLVRTLEVERVLGSIDAGCRILEIGGGYRPRFPSARYPNVRHIDHCNRTDLVEKYLADPTTRHLVDDIQTIDYVCTDGDFRSVIPPECRFDVIFSSHCLEHQVDLLGHLGAMQSVLALGGRIVLVIPDHRACFDAYRFPTVTADVIAVHRRGGKTHQGRQVFDAVAQSLQFNGGRKLNRLVDGEEAQFTHTLEEAMAAVLEAEAAGATYRDLHAWTFTPASFELLILELNVLGVLDVVTSTVTRRYGNQFLSVLQMPEGSDRESRYAAMQRRRLELSGKVYGCLL